MTILATLILAYFAMQSIRLTTEMWKSAHPPIWAIWQAIVTLSLILPIVLIWS